jgi:hypothetical protein
VGKVIKVRRGDFFRSDDPDVEIAFLRVRESKETTDGENALGGGARITWVPDDLYEDVIAYCEENGIGDGDPLSPNMGYESHRQFIVDARENAAKRSGNDNYRHVTSHDFRRYFATNMIRGSG